MHYEECSAYGPTAICPVARRMILPDHQDISYEGVMQLFLWPTTCVRCDYFSHGSRISYVIFILIFIYLYSHIFIFILYSIYVVLLFGHALFSLLLLR